MGNYASRLTCAGSSNRNRGNCSTLYSPFNQNLNQLLDKSSREEESNTSDDYIELHSHDNASSISSIATNEFRAARMERTVGISRSPLDLKNKTSNYDGYSFTSSHSDRYLVDGDSASELLIHDSINDASSISLSIDMAANGPAKLFERPEHRDFTLEIFDEVDKVLTNTIALHASLKSQGWKSMEIREDNMSELSGIGDDTDHDLGFPPSQHTFRSAITPVYSERTDNDEILEYKEEDQDIKAQRLQLET